MKNVQDHAEDFDRWAPTYDRSPLQRFFFHPVHRRILRLLDPRPGERFLELGSGTGNLAMAAAARTGLAVGVDPSPRMVELATRKLGELPPGARARFLVGVAEALPMKDDTFDLAATSISMHHWVDLEGGFRQIRRVVRPGGRVLVADVAPRGYGKAIAMATGFWQSHQGDVWDPRELAGTLELAGFTRIRLWNRGPWSRLVAFVAAEVPRDKRSLEGRS